MAISSNATNNIGGQSRRTLVEASSSREVQTPQTPGGASSEGQTPQHLRRASTYPVSQTKDIQTKELTINEINLEEDKETLIKKETEAWLNEIVPSE
jgi:hypothetical protein